MSSAPVQLPYADLPARCGISFERTPHLFRVSIPPTPGWRYLGRTFHVTFALLVAWIALEALIKGRGAWLRGGAEWWMFLIDISLFGLGLLAMLAHALERLRYRIVLEVDERALTMTVLSPRRVIRRASWTREQVREAEYNVSNGKLVLRITGTDPFEVFISPRRDVTEVVAREVNDAPSEPFTTSVGGSLPSREAPPMTAPLRTALITTSMIIALIGVGLFFTPVGLAAISVLILAGIPAGIALGTQEKEYYL